MTPERWQQIEQLYHEARARPALERSAFLAAACPADEGLRREVEHLLSQPGSDEGFLAGPVSAMAAGLTARSAAMTGRTLGGYHVQALIGVGGMGEVYRARDEKLGRAVAIKVLPHAFTSNPARLARFEREARTLAALNHPNICSIHGFEEADGVRFLILELVDGDTVADMIVAARQRPDGPCLPQREALNVARQIARALDFAHERGIVHRDLKPANIKVTRDGAAKVLDFGLAKAAVGDAAGADVGPLAPTVTDGTIEGTIIGTPAYMSPEQARGRPIDKRTDIWAFGCVLFEMLTGRAAFSGDTAAETIARILEREPDWTALPTMIPEPIRNLLLGCLAKDPRERLRDIGDVRITIDSILSGASSTATVVPAVPMARPRAPWLPWTIVAVLGVVIAGLAIWGLRPQPSLQVSQWTVDLPGQTLDGSGGAHIVTLSRDGTKMAYVASPRLLYLRPMDQDAKPLPGTETYKGVRDVEFSPDGKRIAFYAFLDHTLKWMPTAGGGAATTICEATTPTGINWGSDDIVLFGQGRNGIWRVSASGGTPRKIASISEGQEAHGPQLLPDRDHFLFTIATGSLRDRWDKGQIVVQSLSTAKRTRLDITGSDARYVRTGDADFLVYAVGGTVYAVAFDPQELSVKGTSVPVQEGVSRASGAVTGAANFSVSDNGHFVFVPGPVNAASAKMDVALIDPVTRNVEALALPSDAYASLRMSPDESQIAFWNESDTQSRIYTFGVSGTTPQPLTSRGSNRYPEWTRDSRRVAFQSDQGGNLGIWWQAVNSTDEPERLTTAAAGDAHIPESFSEDTLLYSVTNKNGNVSLWTLPFRNGKPGTAVAFGKSISDDPMSGVFSPDGRLVAYTLTERGMTTICVEPFPATGPRECLPQRFADTAKHPRWAPDGERLYFDPRPKFFESVSVTARPVLRFGRPENVEFHPFRLGPPGMRTPYDVTRSGKYLGLISPGKSGFELQSLNQIQVILNWFEVLKEKVPR